MDIKLIALDLDGTLLDSEKRLSLANKAALRRCCDNGIVIVPTTGRTVDGIPSSIKEIPGIRYAITTNGAVIEDMAEHSTLYLNSLSWELALDILMVMEQYRVMYDPYVDRRGISESKFYDHLEEYGLNAGLIEMVRQTRDVHDNIIEFVRRSQKPVEKINLFFSDKQERTKVRCLLEHREDIVITSSMPFNLELNAIGVSKGDGLLRLADRLGIAREHTMAVGDGENDISMIRAAGVGVAMKNGLPSLLSIADYITGTNDEDGVAAAINRFIPEVQ